MIAETIAPDTARFIVVAFEGPDAYSQAGGLGVRVTGLVEMLARLDYETHLFFIGDPDAPGGESRCGGRLRLHRWAQWISACCPGGVYDGENEKAVDLAASLPAYLVETLIVPAIAVGEIPVLIFEEWQTTECACRVSEALVARGLRDRVVMFWNANNPYGFDRIEWRRLARAATVTTISRHMRSIIRSCGVDARVIPNGIPDSSFDLAPRDDVGRIRAALASRPGAGFLFKMARWEREKGWSQALDAVASARSGNAMVGNHSLVLVARTGGPTGQGASLEADGRARGLRVDTFDSAEQLAAVLSDSVRDGVDVVNLRFGVCPVLARTLFAAADGVLANSVSEPFGLVGLEAMAAGGIAITGGTGEDYAIDGRNAVVLQSLDPDEIVARWAELAASPELATRIRRSARRTARDYRWHTVVGLLLDAVTREARRQALLRVLQVDPAIGQPDMNGAFLEYVGTKRRAASSAIDGTIGSVPPRRSRLATYRAR